MTGLAVAFFLCLGLAVYLGVVLGKALNTPRRDNLLFQSKIQKRDYNDARSNKYSPVWPIQRACNESHNDKNDNKSSEDAPNAHYVTSVSLR